MSPSLLSRGWLLFQKTSKLTGDTPLLSPRETAFWLDKSRNTFLTFLRSNWTEPIVIGYELSLSSNQTALRESACVPFPWWVERALWSALLVWVTADTSYGLKDPAAMSGTIRHLQPYWGLCNSTPAVRAWVLLRVYHPQRRLHYGRPTAAAGSALCDQRTIAQAPLPRSTGHA